VHGGKNPIKIQMENKLIDCGFKLYALVDYETNIIIDFIVEDGTYKRTNCGE